MSDRPSIVTVYGDRGPIVEVLVPADELKEFLRRPEIAAVHWKRRGLWSTSGEDRARIVDIIEEDCAEYMTPARVTLVRELLAGDEPLDASTIRDRAGERGVSFGHGNALLAYLQKHAHTRDGDELMSFRRRYTLSEAELLAADWEAGPGRGE